MSWESTFEEWAKPPSKTEKEKCENAERVIKGAIDADDELSELDITVFPQGSYKARTNLGSDSDVDICVCLGSTFYYDLPDNTTPQDFDITPSSRTYSWFKDKVENALVERFGRENVERGNKAIDVHENTYRVAADVVPVFEYRRYTGKNNYGQPMFEKGVKLMPDKGGQIINWPDQSYSNGVRKNKSTEMMYKKVVRILKNLRNKMQEDDVTAAENIASCLIEHLCWNVPHDGYDKLSYHSIIRSVLAHTFNNTISLDRCKEWGEINELKYLFGTWQPAPGQDWTIDRTHAFLDAAWDYIGYQ